MRSFFDRERLAVPYKSEKGILSCVSCGLYKTALTPKITPYGNFKKGIMVIGEGPGENDDGKGVPWQGKIGRVLQRKYKQLGIDLFEDCVSLNAVNCRPTDKKGSTRPPTDYEIACCRQKIITAVKKYNPKVIILHGNSAVSSLISGYRWKGNPSGISAWRGWAIPDRVFKAWVCPTFHPSFIEKQEDSEAGVIWGNDLKQAFDKNTEPFPTLKNEEDCIIIAYDVKSVLTNLLKQEPSELAFDIETTGLKPYNKENHEIVVISFCYEMNRAWVIPMPTEREDLRLLKKILENPKINKIAANMKYEDNWLVTLHGINTSPWGFDTMQASHILDNRPGITGLKFQTYVNFGLSGYDDEVAPYLKGPDANTPNRILELKKSKPLFRKLLLYGGVDSLVTFRLSRLQKAKLGMPVL